MIAIHRDAMSMHLVFRLLFMKPFLFVSREDITGISAAKVGTGRTFNVNITLDDSSEIEFSMLEYEELGVMKVNYKHAEQIVLVCMCDVNAGIYGVDSKESGG